MKRIIIGILCAAMILCCAGCNTKDKTQDNTTGTAENGTTSTAENNTTAAESDTASAVQALANANEQQAYMDFLNGKIPVTTSEEFRADDEQHNYDGLLYGSYSFNELKAAIAELEMSESVTKYAFQDFGQDGENQLVLRFESTNQTFNSWVGIIDFNGSGLDLTYYYEDGGRTFSKLYTSGYLQLGGSMSAGSSTASIVKFDKNGSATELFKKSEYYGIAASSIIYDLEYKDEDLRKTYNDIDNSSELFVREYVTDDTVKIAVIKLSEDSAVRSKEDELINDIMRLGAQQITGEEMDKLCSLTPYESDEIAWQEWNEDVSLQADAIVSADFASEELLKQPEAYHEFVADSSEYQVKVAFSTNTEVKDFRVLSLSIKDVSDSGETSFSSEELYSLTSLTPEKPLVVTMAFAGDVPNMGISYTDSSGTQQVYSISMSGMDGSLLLVKANLE